jgi:hypothetical protein
VGCWTENTTSGSNLTERRFREYWEETDGDGTHGNDNVHDRFRQVLQLIERDAEERVNVHSTNSPVNNAIREHFTDGRWHSPSSIAARIDHPREVVERALNIAAKRVSNKYKVNKRPDPRRVGLMQYQVLSLEKTISSMELKQKLGPIIERLRAQGRTNEATVSISEIAHLASELQRLLNDWT